jgi:hypothetical protein
VVAVLFVHVIDQSIARYDYACHESAISSAVDNVVKANAWEHVSYASISPAIPLLITIPILMGILVAAVAAILLGYIHPLNRTTTGR